MFYRGRSTSEGGATYYVAASSEEHATSRLAEGLKTDDGFLEGEARRANLTLISSEE